MKQRIKKVSKVTTTLIIVFSILLVTLLSLTMAYFTDSKKYTGTLNFGNVKLKVTDKNNTEMNDGDTIVFDITRTGEVTQKLMPGDTIGINFNVSLQGGDNPSEPAYYLVSISDTEGVLDEATYYHDGTNVVKNTDSAKSVGELTVGQTHAFNISKQVPTDETRRGVKTTVSVKVYAVQKANLEKYNATDTSKSAYHILIDDMTPEPTANLPTLNDIKSVVTNWSKLTSNGFYYTKDVPSGYSLIADLTSSLDAKLDADSKGLLKIYKKSDTEIAFASDIKIKAPVSCNSLFGSGWDLPLVSLNLSNFDTSDVTDMSYMFNECIKLQSLDLSNFDTSKVTSMNGMFNNCYALTGLDVKNFDTREVTNMRSMFRSCKVIGSLDLSSFDTNSVTTMESMFEGCYALKKLNISNFDTSNVTTMASMFASCALEDYSCLIYLDTMNVTSMNSMFSGCKATSLDFTKFANFKTSSVVNMTYMFDACAVTNINLSSFDTSKVTSMSGMFRRWKGTTLDLSSFDTSSVTNWDQMFNGYDADSKLTNLTISENFVYGGTGDVSTCTQFTKSVLISKTRMSSSVTVTRNGSTLS